MIKERIKNVIDRLIDIHPFFTLAVFSLLYPISYQTLFYLKTFAYSKSILPFYPLIIFIFLIFIVKFGLVFTFARLFSYTYNHLFDIYRIQKTSWRIITKLLQVFICEFLLLLLFFLITKSSLWTFMLLLKDLYLSNTIFSFVFSLGLIIRVLLMSLTLFIHE